MLKERLQRKGGLFFVSEKECEDKPRRGSIKGVQFLLDAMLQ